MRVAVTGGAGFIGANVAASLTDGGHDVVVLDDFSTGRRRNLDGIDLEIVEGSILDDGDLARTFADADAIVHLAARPSVPVSVGDPAGSWRVNATGTIAVLEAVRRHAPGAHLMASSSSSVYGSNPVLPKHEELACQPLSPYAAAKLAMEQATLAWAHTYGLDVLVFRFFNVFGPFQPADHPYAAVVPSFVSAALAGRPLSVHGDGSQSRDFTFVGSVAALVRDAVERRVTSPGPMNLAFGTRVTLLELIGVLEEVMRRPLDVEHTDPRPGDVLHSQADAARLRDLFHDVEPVDLRDGLRQTVAWLSQNLPA